MLGDPVSQHGQHPHGGRRARDGHLPLGRLTERVTGGFLKHETMNQNFKVSFSVFYFPHHIRKITRVA